MPNTSTVMRQLTEITQKFIRLNLSVDQNFPSNKDGYISYSEMQDVSIAMKNISYEEIYKKLNSGRNYNIKMLDGALIQMFYIFNNKKLVSHRLAFFPAPNIESFQNEPEFYERDEIYADILARNVVTFPIRFDYDPKNFKELEHSKTHATFGQYKNCRIPVSEPLTPEIFVIFILRNFYNTAFEKYSDEFTVSNCRFAQTITSKEKSLLHFTLD